MLLQDGVDPSTLALHGSPGSRFQNRPPTSPSHSVLDGGNLKCCPPALWLLPGMGAADAVDTEGIATNGASS